MNPIAYTYEASEHCPACAEARFGTDERGDIASGVLDNEGNEPGAVFSWDEWDRALTCGTCGEAITEDLFT
jgi:hypothetical protein